MITPSEMTETSRVSLSFASPRIDDVCLKDAAVRLFNLTRDLDLIGSYSYSGGSGSMGTCRIEVCRRRQHVITGIALNVRYPP